MWTIISLEERATNFGWKNKCIIVDVLYFRRVHEDGRLVFTRQLEQASTYESRDHAESRVDELNASKARTYLTPFEIK